MADVLNVQNNPRKVKGGGRKIKNKIENLSIFSTNAAGLKNKIESFKNELQKSNAAIFTHFNKKGKFKLEIF